MKLGNAITAQSFLNKVQLTTKVIQSADPQIECTTTKDKFKFNPAALDLLGIKANSTVRVLMIDSNIGVSEPSERKDFNSRFFVAVNPLKDGNKGLVSKGGDFSYAGPWAVINSGREDVTQIPHKDLCELGLVLEREGEKGSNYIAYHKYVFDLSRYIVEDEEGNEIKEFQLSEDSEPQAIYQMTNMRVFDHNPEVSE